MTSTFGNTNSTFGSASSSISYLAERPDLSLLSDPNVVVHFRNLSKKDATTKSRALDELIQHMSKLSEDSKTLEESFIDAWVKVFPRLSVDSSRRVRQTTFVLQRLVSKASGKRLARHMPSIAPAWLAGEHDGDKAVARTAHDGLQAMFGTAEKQRNLRKAYQTQILQFGTDVVERETAESLSDPKGTSKDDAEAMYNRVFASGLKVISDTMQTLQNADRAPHTEEYISLLSSQSLWNRLADGDTNARRAIYSYLRVNFANLPEQAAQQVPEISKVLLSKRASRHQIGTAHLYIEALTLVATRNPHLWTSDRALEVIQSIGKHGSQASPTRFWLNLGQLVEALSDDVLPRDAQQVCKTLDALNQGATRKDEPRTNLPAAFRCYFKALNRLIEFLNPDDRTKTLQEWAMPIITNYVRPTSATSRWALPSPSAIAILTDSLQSEVLQSTAELKWPDMTSELVNDIKTSLPAQSKDFEKSQLEVEDQGKRLFGLQTSVVRNESMTTLTSAFARATKLVLDESTALLKSRDGKPFGAAGCLLAALEYHYSASSSDDAGMEADIDRFLVSDLPHLLATPSRSRLTSILSRHCKREVFQDVYTSCLSKALESSDASTKRETVLSLVTMPADPQDSKVLLENQELQRYLSELLQTSLEARQDHVELDQLLKKDPSPISSDTLDKLTESFTSKLDLNNGEPLQALEALRYLSRQQPQFMKDFAATERGYSLMQSLLRAQEGGDGDESMIATEMLSMLGSDATKGTSGASRAHVAQVLARSLYEADLNSLSVSTLSDLGVERFQAAPEETTLQSLLPDTSRWSAVLEPFLSVAPPAAFAVTDDMGSFSMLASKSAKVGAFQPPSVDAEGMTALLRIAIYATRLLREAGDVAVKLLQSEEGIEKVRLMILTAQVANDRLTCAPANPLWEGSFLDDEIIDYISETRKMTEPLFTSDPKSSAAASTLLYHMSGSEPQALHHAREWARAQSQAIEKRGWRKEHTPQIEEQVTQLKKSDRDFFQLGAHIIAFQQPLNGSSALLRIVNETIADLTGAKPDLQLEVVSRKTALLALIVRSDDQTLDDVAKQRLVFFVKHVVQWLTMKLPDAFKADLLRSLTSILPHMSDTYGEDWEKILDFLIDLWRDAKPLTPTASTSATVALWHASLKLFATLRGLLRYDETNDDLKEAAQEKGDDVAAALASLLKQSGGLSDDKNQPLRATYELLARQIKAVPATKLGDLSGLYALLDTESHEVQQTAYEVLHRQIPREQEDISVNVALEKSVARLPDELLSLIFVTSDPDLIDDLDTARAISPPLFTYLASWILVFDHFKSASYKVQSDYVAHIKEQGVHISLLDLIYASLSTGPQGRLIDAGKFDAISYSFGIETDPKKDIHWLLVFLYSLCLHRIPSLTKTWWRDNRSRQIRAAVEPWTEKYFSPIVIGKALDSVAEWAKEQDTTSEDSLIVKVKEATHEVTASRDIEGQTLTIAVRLPPNFPLGQVTVEGVNRIGVPENKWRSMLLNTQGVIAFSDNSIQDGLIVFRRNVNGHLKGQSECAICYSIVSSDKQLPTKRCRTCKNLFHGSCLFKWFKSGNTSTCPLCRTAFNYA